MQNINVFLRHSVYWPTYTVACFWVPASWTRSIYTITQKTRNNYYLRRHSLHKIDSLSDTKYMAQKGTFATLNDIRRFL